MDWQTFTIGERLRFACQMMRRDMQDAAVVAGVDRTTFYNVGADRAGKFGPTIGTLRAIADGLGIRLCWLVAGEGEVWQTQKAAGAEAPAALPTMPMTPLKDLRNLKNRKRSG